MRLFGIVGLAMVPLLAVTFAAEDCQLNPHELQAVVDGLRQLNEAQSPPECLAFDYFFGVKYLNQCPGTFDANQYFDVLKHLSVEPGYQLSYFYWTAMGNGRPLLYAQSRHEISFTPRGWSWDDDSSGLGDEALVDSLREDLLNHVVADGTPESFFELVVLHIMGGQFYLMDHCNYSDWRVVCDSVGLRDLLTELEEWNLGDKPGSHLEKGAYEVSLDPRVNVSDSICTVSLVAFSKWSGFVRFEYRFLSTFPHHVDTVIMTPEVEYDCGVRF